MTLIKKLPIDAYMVLLICTVGLAVVAPVSGQAAILVSRLGSVAVALLFFLYGAKLKTQVVLAGFVNWRLQGLILLMTYVLFPLLGLAIFRVGDAIFPHEILVGIVYLTLLPSTIQSSIALSAMARGNVAASLCAASVSNLLGVVVTPLLATLLLSTAGFVLDVRSVLSIIAQIMLPFAAGQIVRPLISGWLERNKLITTVVDRGSILLIVYSAFSAGMIAGVWSKIDLPILVALMVLAAAMLAVAIVTVRFFSKLLGFDHADATTLLFAGIQKSLASGVPIANILFVGQAVSIILLPLMLYHQMQLFVSAFLAQQHAKELSAARP
ncbi:bile acid:sodium symporter family protein [Mesorhizobium sp. CO1-1-8]|uniref:bile acid:sodium symporter family protein n=1 Tax=Mesorhizobium sp. CO1-1-8 TaxID=2876631 RepID=UPI001CD0D541|nr:bile acid:sodium symporter family protein [Mesorhizobium sp. CO1-1-8]MBZ9772587.1 bile acid:sodium symporter [Mesorhizobium sp. CO1-1-8]